MANIQETSLPGVGVRHDFVTRDGQRLGVISHRSGRRDLLVYNKRDPDSCAQTMRLEEDEADALIEVLGGSRVAESLSNLQQNVAGLTIDWLPISASWSCSGHTLAEAAPALRTLTGVSLVAVVRGQETIPTPPLDFRLLPGDVAVVVGTPEAIQRAAALLR